MDDRTVIKKVLEGDREAFSLLVEKYHRRLLGLAFRILRDPALAEDVGQEAFFRAYQNLSSFDDERGIPFSAWLFTITRNLAVDALRKKIRQQALAASAGEEIADVEDPRPGSLAELLGKERRIELSDCLDQVPEPYQSTLRMQLEGKSLAQIARGQGVAWGTVKSRLARARQSLALLMRGKEDEDGI